MRSLAERMQAYEQQKARLANVEAKLKLAERKARTRRLLKIGELAEKVGMMEMDEKAVYGALLTLDIDNEKLVRQWATEGAAALEREKLAEDEGKQPVVLNLRAEIDRDATAELRAAGFRFNRVLRHWEGFSRLDDAEDLADRYDGTARSVGAPPAPPAPPTSQKQPDPAPAEKTT